MSAKPALRVVRSDPPPHPFKAKLAARGLGITYRGDGTDVCLGCGRRQFHVGRRSAECAYCSTVVPFAEGWS